MKTLARILVGLIFSTTIFAQSPSELGVAAIGYVVSDIGASEFFYTDIIGMVPAGEFSLDEAWSKDAGVANGKPFSVKMFKMVDAPSATILKLAYFETMEDRPNQSGVDQSAGVNYLTLHYSTEEFYQVVERVKRAEIEVLGWVKRESYQLVFIKDPDGLFVELVGPPD